jgi:TRAP-type C4-dicarboxylate transport system permease small subunit
LPCRGTGSPDDAFSCASRRFHDAHGLWLAIGFLLIAAALAMYQVTTRFVFGSPSTWSEVITRSAMIWSVFLGVAPAFREGSMIALEFIQHALPRRLGLALYQIGMALTLLFFSILFWQGWIMTGRVARTRASPRSTSPSPGPTARCPWARPSS